MTSWALAVSILLSQSPGPLPSGTCASPSDTAVASLCAGEEAMSRGDRAAAADDERDEARSRALAAFRRAAELTRDQAIRKRALEQLARLFDPDHLDLPRDEESTLRQLIAMSGADVGPILRLAKLQERQGLFDAAESTLLAAHQQKPDDIAPYRELAQFFARRAADMSAQKDREARAVRAPDEAGKPDKDGVYRLGNGVQAPEKVSSESVAMPPEVTAAGITGTVGMEVVVDETGAVREAKVIRSVPGLDATALASVKQWRFAPAMVNGRPVPVRMPVAIRFGER